MRLRFGLGYVGEGSYRSKVSGIRTKEYSLWTEMFKRGFCKLYKTKFPTYLDCYVCEEWYNFQNFAQWCNNQIGFNENDFELDKDLLIQNNKIYSPDTCCFIPKAINYSLVSKRRLQTLHNLPLGVGKLRNGTYQASVSISGRKKVLGTFSSPEEASECYKRGKEKRLKELAEVWKSKMSIEAYNALYNHEVK